MWVRTEFVTRNVFGPGVQVQVIPGPESCYAQSDGNKSEKRDWRTEKKKQGKKRKRKIGAEMTSKLAGNRTWKRVVGLPLRAKEKSAADVRHPSLFSPPLRENNKNMM